MASRRAEWWREGWQQTGHCRECGGNGAQHLRAAAFFGQDPFAGSAVVIMVMVMIAPVVVIVAMLIASLVTVLVIPRTRPLCQFAIPRQPPSSR